MLHPLRSMKLYSTPEGRNLRDGDFNIGEIYREHGRLKFEQVENPTVSIIIPVYNQIHYTYACLLSILEHTKDVSYEVIIADDVSTDATEHLSEYAEGLVDLQKQHKPGLLRNCNNAARHARGKYVMFLNNDTQVAENWLSPWSSSLSRPVHRHGRLQAGVPGRTAAGGRRYHLERRLRLELWPSGQPGQAEYNYVKDVDYISGAAILLSNELWNQIGGFDTRFAPAYCEDSDLAFEVRKAGYRVVYQPKSKVIHFEGISNGTDVQGTGLKRYQVAKQQEAEGKMGR
ncbi:MAG: glycosyltransferase family 2 protein [Clostridium sp.]